MKTQYTKTEDGLLRETKEPIVPVEDFTREQIEDQIKYHTALVAQAQEGLDMWTARQGKADEKGVVAKADIAVEVVEPIIEPVKEDK